MGASIRSIIQQSYAPMLKAFDSILEKAADFAGAKQTDLANARLAPDMFTLAQQVQIATYFAREIPERLTTGDSIGELGDPPTSIDGMRQRVAEALEALGAASDRLEEAGTVRCVIEPGGRDIAFEMNGEEYLLRWSLPNFYFHLVTAYGILRKQGVEIGKIDYLASNVEFMRPRG